MATTATSGEAPTAASPTFSSPSPSGNQPSSKSEFSPPYQSPQMPARAAPSPLSVSSPPSIKIPKLVLVESAPTSRPGSLIHGAYQPPDSSPSSSSPLLKNSMVGVKIEKDTDHATKDPSLLISPMHVMPTRMRSPGYGLPSLASPKHDRSNCSQDNGPCPPPHSTADVRASSVSNLKEAGGRPIPITPESPKSSPSAYTDSNSVSRAGRLSGASCQVRFNTSEPECTVYRTSESPDEEIEGRVVCRRSEESLRSRTTRGSAPSPPVDSEKWFEDSEFMETNSSSAIQLGQDTSLDLGEAENGPRRSKSVFYHERANVFGSKHSFKMTDSRHVRSATTTSESESSLSRISGTGGTARPPSPDSGPRSQSAVDLERGHMGFRQRIRYHGSSSSLLSSITRFAFPPTSSTHSRSRRKHPIRAFSREPHKVYSRPGEMLHGSNPPSRKLNDVIHSNEHQNHQGLSHSRSLQDIGAEVKAHILEHTGIRKRVERRRKASVASTSSTASASTSAYERERQIGFALVPGAPSPRKTSASSDRERRLFEVEYARRRLRGGAAARVSMGGSPGTQPSPWHFPPIVYPALLSRVALVFRRMVHVNTHYRDGLEYNQCFNGVEAVDTLSCIIKTADRNLALLVGRALGEQRWFHDVTYTHRLRDSMYELYSFTRAQEDTDDQRSDHPQSPAGVADSERSRSVAADCSVPTGVITLLTDCYSSTCSPDRLCYSITCPRRLEQQTRLNMTPSAPLLQRSQSASSLDTKMSEDRLWSTSTPKEIMNGVGETERRRQETIFEIIQTEEKYVSDLDVLESLYLLPLQSSSIIPEERRTHTLQGIFSNFLEIRALNRRLLTALQARQRENYVCSGVGDVFAGHVESMVEPYVLYGSHHPEAMYILENEVARNPQLQRFLEAQERHVQSRKLPIQSFLARPSTRMGRYLLLLEAVKKRSKSVEAESLDEGCDAAADDSDLKSPNDHDCADLDFALSRVRGILDHINLEAGKAADRLELRRIEERLVCKGHEIDELKLRAPSRRLIKDGTMAWKKKSSQGTDEVKVFLFDHAIMVVKPVSRKKSKLSGYKVVLRPIPLEVLHVSIEGSPSPSAAVAFSGVEKDLDTMLFHHRTPGPDVEMEPIGDRGLGDRTFGGVSSLVPFSRNSASELGLVLSHLGKSDSVTLIPRSQTHRESWRGAILSQKQARLREKKPLIRLMPLCRDIFPPGSHVHTSVQLDERRIILGTDDGLYVGYDVNSEDPWTPPTTGPRFEFVRLLSLDRVHQIDVLAEFNLFLILAGKERELSTLPLDQVEQHCHVYLADKRTAWENKQAARAAAEWHMREGTHSGLLGAAAPALACAVPPHQKETLCAAKLMNLPSLLTMRRLVKSHINFFKAGIYNQQTLVAVVKSSAFTCTIRTYEPMISNKRPGGLQKLLGRRNSQNSIQGRVNKLSPTKQPQKVETMKFYQDLYIPSESTSVHFLRAKLCIGCTKGFEVVDLHTLASHGLLDPNDESLSFVSRREAVKPIAMFSYDQVFLLCYDEFGFFVNKVGRRVRPNILMHWEACPTAFAFVEPYVVAFDRSFVEVRNVDSGDIEQLIPIPGLTPLNTRPDLLHCVMEADGTNRWVFKLVPTFKTSTDRVNTTQAKTTESMRIQMPNYPLQGSQSSSGEGHCAVSHKSGIPPTGSRDSTAVVAPSPQGPSSVLRNNSSCSGDPQMVLSSPTNTDTANHTSLQTCTSSLRTQPLDTNESKSPCTLLTGEDCGLGVGGGESQSTLAGQPAPDTSHRITQAPEGDTVEPVSPPFLQGVANCEVPSQQVFRDIQHSPALMISRPTHDMLSLPRLETAVSAITVSSTPGGVIGQAAQHAGTSQPS